MKKRFLTAFIMLLIGVPCLLIGKIPLIVLSIIIGFIGNHELLNACGKNFNTIDKIITYILVSCIYLEKFTNFSNYLFSLLMLSLFIFTLFSFKKNIEISYVWIYYICFILLVNTINLVINYNENPIHIIYLVTTICLTDAFALFGGKLLGKHKLCEHISPNKTIEGSIIGTIFGSIIGAFVHYIFIYETVFLFSLIFTIGISIISQIGDLFFSTVKRYTGIKDFGRLLPGHGGVLDRIDSLSFGFLFYSILTQII